MKNDILLTIPIEDIWELEDDDMITVAFTIENLLFRLVMIKTKNGSYSPYVVSHFSDPDDCIFCSKESNLTWRCEELTRNISLLLPRLIESNAIRLNWIYREYELE